MRGKEGSALESGCPVLPEAPGKSRPVVVTGGPRYDAALIHSRRSTDLAPSVARGEVLVEVT